MIDYIAIMQEYHGGRNDGFLTDQPVIPIYLTKERWVLIDIIVAIIFLITVFILRRNIW